MGLALAYRLNTSINGGWGNSNFYVGFPRVSYQFFVGALLYIMYKKYGVNSKALAFLLIGTLFLSFCITYTPWKMFTLFVLAPLTVLLSAKADMQGHTGRVFQFLGDLSYPLYIVHWPVFQLLYLFVDFGQLNPSGKLATMSLVTLGFAWSLIHFDRYCRGRLMRTFAP